MTETESQHDVPGTRAARGGSRTLETLLGPIEAVLLSADRAVPASKVAQAVGLAPVDQGDSRGLSKEAAEMVEAAVGRLNAEYESGGRTFRIEHVAGGLRLMTLPEFAPYIAALQQQKTQGKLSKASVETLAIIAYRQPVTRAEIESIRGVACGEVLKTLIDHRLITIAGRAEELGRPMLYGTTRQFLDSFGLASLQDLPPMAEFGAKT
ncbi:MAG: SMC-Scp complex subunit ScpB [Phycisphaerales bacterium]|nr:SMC-Scp complex subunit ScpB [Phycisphaerales bacterium]